MLRFHVSQQNSEIQEKAGVKQMAKKIAGAVAGRRKGSTRSLAIAKSGIKTGHDFSALMSNLMSDLIEERISPVTANAVCNAGGKLLKMVEMEFKYGTRKAQGRGNETLLLSENQD